MMADIND